MENNKIYFTKKNYAIILAGIITFVIGYFVMSGGNPENPAEYSDDIFNFRRLTLAPFIVIAGYVLVLIGIIKNFNNTPDASELDSTESDRKIKKG